MFDSQYDERFIDPSLTSCLGSSVKNTIIGNDHGVLHYQDLGGVFEFRDGISLGVG